LETVFCYISQQILFLLPIFDDLPTKIGFAEIYSKKRLGLVLNPKKLLGYTGAYPTGGDALIYH
jgi:hypothetical protein